MAEGTVRNIWDVINHVKVEQPKLPTETEKLEDEGSRTENCSTSRGYDPLVDKSSMEHGYGPLHDESLSELPACSMDNSNSSGSLDDSTTNGDMCSKDSTPKRSRKSGPFTCDICGDHLSTRSTLKNHRARRHGQAARFECSICGHRYNNRGEYQDHVDGHTGVRRHKCDTCEMTFTHKSSQSAHKKVCKGTNIIPSLNVIRDRLKFGTKKQATKQSIDESAPIVAESDSAKLSAQVLLTKRFDIPVLEKHELLLQKQIKSRAKKSPPKKQNTKRRGRPPSKRPKNSTPPIVDDQPTTVEPVIENSQANDNNGPTLPAMTLLLGTDNNSPPPEDDSAEAPKFTQLVLPPKSTTRRKPKRSLAKVDLETKEYQREGRQSPNQLKIHIMSCLPDPQVTKQTTRKRGRRKQTDKTLLLGATLAVDKENESQQNLETPTIETVDAVKESVVVKVSTSPPPTTTCTGPEEQNLSDLVDTPLDLSTARSTPSPFDTASGSLPKKTEPDDQPLDLSVRRPQQNNNYCQKWVDNCATSVNNSPVTTNIDSKPKSPNIRVQNSIFQTFSVSGLQGRKVSPVRPHIRGKPVRNISSSLTIESDCPNSDRVDAIASPTNHLPGPSISVSHNHNIGSNTTISTTLENLNACSSQNVQVTNTVSRLPGCILKISPDPPRVCRKRTYQDSHDSCNIVYQNGHTLSTTGELNSSDTHSPLKPVSGVKRSIPTAHVKPNQLESCSSQETKSQKTRSDQEQPPKDLLHEIYDAPPLLEESVRALSSSLESISDGQPMPVLSPHRDGLLSPNSTQNKSDNFTTSPPTLTRLSPLPGTTARSNIASDTETSTGQSPSPLRENSHIVGSSVNTSIPPVSSSIGSEKLPLIKTKEECKLDVHSLGQDQIWGVNERSPKTGEFDTTRISEPFQFVRDIPTDTKSSSIWCQTDFLNSPGMIAFDYCPSQVKRYRMDITNTRYYSQLITGKKGSHAEIGCHHDTAYDHTTQRNIQESAFPSLTLTNDWRKDQVTYKLNNLRIPKKLITMPQKTPQKFMQGIEKFCPKLPVADVKGSKTAIPGNSSTSEAPKKRRSLKSCGTEKTSTKSAALNSSTEEQGEAAKDFTIKLVKLTQVNIRKALTALKVPESKCGPDTKTEYPSEPPSAPVNEVSQIAKTNQRILEILRRGGMEVNSERKTPAADSSRTETNNTNPKPVKRRGRKRKLRINKIFTKHTRATTDGLQASSSATVMSSTPLKDTSRATQASSSATVMSSTPLKDTSRATLLTPSGTSPIKHDAVITSTPIGKRSPSPKKSPRRSPRSPRSPRKFSGDRWIFPTKLHRSLPLSSFSGEISHPQSLSFQEGVDLEHSSARRNLSDFGSVSPGRKSPSGVKGARRPSTPPKETAAQKRARQKRSLLAQLASSEGYIADKQKNNENLLVDPSQLNREERALQRALMKITEMEIQAKFAKLSQNKVLQSPKKSSCTRKADELKKKARRVGNQTAMGKTLKQKYEDFRPLVLGARTRLQATGREERRGIGIGFFHKDLAYEQALKFDEQRKAHKRCTRKVSQHQAPSIEQPQIQTPVSPVAEASQPTSHRLLDSVDETIEAVVQGFCHIETEPATTVKKCLPTKGKRTPTGTPPRAKRPTSNRKKAQISRQSHFVGNQYTPQIEIDIAEDSLVQLQAEGIRHAQDDDALSISSSATGEFARVQVPPEVKRLNVCRDTGETVLHKAARMAYVDIVEWCCKTRYVDVRARDYAGFSALHETCVSESVETARCLLQYGAEVNVASRQDGIRPLHDAIERDNFELVRLFLAWGADPMLSTYSGRTTLQIARTDEMRTFLLSYLADLNGKRAPEEGEEALDMEREWELLPQYPLDGGGSGNSPTGCDILDGVPQDSSESQDLVFHMSEDPHVICYLVSVEESSRPSNHVLLGDLMSKLHKSENEFRIAYPEITVHRCQASSVSGPDSALLRKSGSTKSLALVPYDGKVLEILNIEEYKIPHQIESEKMLSSDATSAGVCIEDSVSNLDNSSKELGDLSTAGSFLDPTTGVFMESPLGDQTASTISFCDDAADDELSQDLDDDDDRLFIGYCKGCSSPEFSENEQDELPFNDYTTRSSNEPRVDTSSPAMNTTQEKSLEEQKPILGHKSVYVSLLSGQTIVQPTSLDFAQRLSSTGAAMKPSTSPHPCSIQNNNTTYACPSSTTPKPLFIISPDDHILASSLASEAADAPSRIIPWEIQEVLNPKKSGADFAVENVFQEVRESSPQTVISSGAGSETETTSENDYGLKIAQVCSLSATDAKNVFGSDVELP